MTGIVECVMREDAIVTLVSMEDNVLTENVELHVITEDAMVPHILKNVSVTLDTLEAIVICRTVKLIAEIMDTVITTLDNVCARTDLRVKNVMLNSVLMIVDLMGPVILL